MNIHEQQWVVVVRGEGKRDFRIHFEGDRPVVGMGGGKR
jgi:hypothetical protein